MVDIETTKRSSKGQIVIPEKIREHLRLKPGSQFVVIGEDDTEILDEYSRVAEELSEQLPGYRCLRHIEISFN